MRSRSRRTRNASHCGSMLVGATDSGSAPRSASPSISFSPTAMWCREHGALRVTDYRHHLRAAVVADVSFGADLALVRVDGSLSTPVIRLAAHNPLSGDKVTLVGFPQGGPGPGGRRSRR